MTTPQIIRSADQPHWEKHFTVAELAQMWHLGRSTVKNWFEREPGVVRHGEHRLRKGRQRPYVSLRIPQSVADRVYKRHTEI